MKTRFALVALVAACLLTPTAALAQRPEAQRPERPEQTERPERPERREAAIDGVKTRCLNQIDRRQRALSADKARLEKARFLTDAHQAALEAINNQTSSGLARLADVIQGEDNVEELRAECRQIVEGFRVFALVRPRSRLVTASDRAIAATTKLGGVADRIQAAIDQAKAENRDTAAAEASLATMRAAIATAASDAGGVYEAVIHLTPADYNANNAVLDRPRGKVRSARDSLKQAIAAGRDARQSLKASAT